MLAPTAILCLVMENPRFVTNAQGERVGIILDLSTYEQMLSSQDDPELLTGMTEVELAALSESELAPGNQQRLQDLAEKSSEQALSESESEQLGYLLEQVDHLNVLKARARYTLKTKARRA